MTARGLYFDPMQLELVPVLDGEVAHGSEHWIRLSPDPGCGLIGARQLLIARGLLDEAAARRVFWRMDSTSENARQPAA